MDLRKFTLAALRKKKRVTSREIVKKTGFSRSYVAKVVKQLVDENKIFLVGKANAAFYTMESPMLVCQKDLANKHLQEDQVLDDIKKRNRHLFTLRKNIGHIVDYAFLEMLNNAIEHSQSKKISIQFHNDASNISFEVRDHGIGIYNNLERKYKLKNAIEAIGHLVKGKQTTMPARHSGEGIFFTSKIADTFTIESGRKRLRIDNTLSDIFIEDIPKIKGTRVIFTISVRKKRDLHEVFKKFTDSHFAFDKTQITVKLYTIGEGYLSRSQARRILKGLEKFRFIIFDFKNVDVVGQAFADEIFRVWSRAHPEIKLEYRHTNENVEFMIHRALT